MIGSYNNGEYATYTASIVLGTYMLSSYNKKEPHPINREILGY